MFDLMAYHHSRRESMSTNSEKIQETSLTAILIISLDSLLKSLGVPEERIKQIKAMEKGEVNLEKKQALIDKVTKKEIKEAEDIFGKKAKQLKPVIPLKWKGKMVKTEFNDINIKGIELEQDIEFALLTQSISGNSFEEIRNTIWKKVQCIKAEFLEDTLQSIPFSVIDVKLQDPPLNNKNAMKTFKEKYKEKVLSLLICSKREIPSYDTDVYRKVDLMKKDSLFNLSSLNTCFISVHPKTALLVRNPDPGVLKEKYVIPSTLEAVTVIAICFVGYSELLLKLADWEQDVFQLIIEKEEILERIAERIQEIIEFHYKSSSLLQFHMSYVTSSAVAQNFFKTFSSISGLDEIHQSLLRKLENCERLLNYITDLYQFKEILKFKVPS